MYTWRKEEEDRNKMKKNKNEIILGDLCFICIKVYMFKYIHTTVAAGLWALDFGLFRQRHHGNKAGKTPYKHYY